MKVKVRNILSIKVQVNTGLRLSPYYSKSGLEKVVRMMNMLQDDDVKLDKTLINHLPHADDMVLLVNDINIVRSLCQGLEP